MITYRQANAFDLPVFVSLDKELFPYSPWSASQYKEEFSAPTRYFVVAIDEQQNIIGYAGVFAPGAAEADVLTIGVVPTERGKGIARQLMAMITDWASQQGSTAMMLEVKVDNVEAIGLYESLGYSKLNVRKDYFGAGLDAVVMRLELS
jgi:[ribosomal protein S18]-alanine N-acetyltransferase